jgi:hypothetical protein
VRADQVLVVAAGVNVLIAFWLSNNPMVLCFVVIGLAAAFRLWRRCRMAKGQS